MEGVEVWAPLAYEGPARALVRGLKYRGAVGLAEHMSAPIAASAPELVRGRSCRCRSTPGAGGSGGTTRPSCSRRPSRAGRVSQWTTASGAAGRRVRARSAAVGPNASGPAGGAESGCGGRPVPGAAVLVDDVATTGATLAACAAALRAAGTRCVTAVVYARTPGR